MDEQKLPSFAPVLLTALILAGIGWLGLFALFLFTLPTLFPRWLFFFLLALAVSGTSLPPIYFLHRRFPSVPSANASVLIREAIWVGAYVDLLAWLQLGKVLNFSLGLFIFAGFAILEFLLRLRERSRFQPPESKNE